MGYGLDEYNYLSSNDLPENEYNALLYSSILLFIAGGHYAVLDVNQPSITSEIIIRYSDWLLTTPLLLLVVTSLYNIDYTITALLIIFDVLMIIFGIMYESTNNIIWWITSFIFYFMIIYLLWTNLIEKDLLYMFFIPGWSLYGLATLRPREERLLYYNFLDIYNKLFFAMVIRNKIVKNVEYRRKV